MPIFRYFIFVGGALLALLLAVNSVLPQDVGVEPAILAASGDLPLIRIHSERKLPERIVLDTSQPTIVPATVRAAAITPKSQQQAEASPVLAEMSAKTRVRETFAQFVPTEHRTVAPVVKRTEAATEARAEAKRQSPPKRKVAKARPAPSPGRPLMLVAQQPHFGPFNMTW